jgi:predicted phage terminase large subunit-like protein
MTEASWEAEYQQNPIIAGGGQIPIVEKLRYLPSWQRGNNKDIKRSVRYIDKAGTEDGGAFTAGVLMHEMRDKSFVISHIFRGQWSAIDREYKIKTYCQADKALLKTAYEVWIEQEPGSGGKESAENTIRNLAGLKATADRVTGKKEARAEPFVAQCQNDNVRIVAGEWTHAFLDECESWPAGKYKDQVDAAAGAFNKLAASTTFSLDPFQPDFVDYDRLRNWWTGPEHLLVGLAESLDLVFAIAGIPLAAKDMADHIAIVDHLVHQHPGRVRAVVLRTGLVDVTKSYRPAPPIGLGHPPFRCHNRADHRHLRRREWCDQGPVRKCRDGRQHAP